MTECKQCIAETSLGEQCKRNASCELGCKLYCWQHAIQYNKDMPNGKCRDPCSSNNNQSAYPCKDQNTNTILWSKEDEQQTYLKHGEKYDANQRQHYLKQFNADWSAKKPKTRHFKAKVKTTNNQSKKFYKESVLNFPAYNPLAKPKRSSMKHAQKK